MLKLGKEVNQYISRKGNATFVFSIEGDNASIEAYMNHQRQFIFQSADESEEDYNERLKLFFTINPNDSEGAVVATRRDGSYYVQRDLRTMHLQDKIDTETAKLHAIRNMTKMSNDDLAAMLMAI